MIRLFVAGTGTGVGKTRLCGLLARRFLSQGLSVRYLKPVQTGHPPDDDAAEVRALSGLPIDRASLLFSAPEPVAPAFVFDPFPFDEAVRTIRSLTDGDVLLVEAAGGLLSPLDRTRVAADLARACDLSTLLCVPVRLGCLNDAALCLHYLRHEGLPVHGLALNAHYAPDASTLTRHRTWFETAHPGLVRCVFDADIQEASTP